MKKTILITGAGTGIGKDAAFALAERGHRVIATTHNETQAESLREECRVRKQVLEVFKLDVCSSVDREKILPLGVEVLINNAAICEAGSLAEVDVNRVRNTFEVNVFAPLELTQLALQGMIVRQSGTVIFVSSLAGRVPMRFMMPYSMSKFALSAAGAGLRAEMDQLGKNIQVALIEPGAFHTGFNQRMAAKKYEATGPKSYFSAQQNSMKEKGEKVIRFIEAQNTRPIVDKIVAATEATRPKSRYVAPWFQGVVVRFARIMGV
jgi:short-subunit dehydrogenase